MRKLGQFMPAALPGPWVSIPPADWNWLLLTATDLCAAATLVLSDGCEKALVESTLTALKAAVAKAEGKETGN